MSDNNPEITNTAIDYETYIEDRSFGEVRIDIGADGRNTFSLNPEHLAEQVGELLDYLMDRILYGYIKLDVTETKGIDLPTVEEHLKSIGFPDNYIESIARGFRMYVVNFGKHATHQSSNWNSLSHITDRIIIPLIIDLENQRKESSATEG